MEQRPPGPKPPEEPRETHRAIVAASAERMIARWDDVLRRLGKS